MPDLGFPVFDADIHLYELVGIARPAATVH
jgi:hypothetical protein